jgi:branched-subunit amino acid transport protein
MTYSTGEIWAIIALLGIGTYAIRLSFLALLGGRELPAMVLRLLRYTPVAMIPGLVAPLVVWPAATAGTPDPARLAAAAAALGVGYLSRNVLAAIASGALVLFLGLWLVG